MQHQLFSSVKHTENGTCEAFIQTYLIENEGIKVTMVYTKTSVSDSYTDRKHFHVSSLE